MTANQRDVGGTQGERGNILSAHGGAAFDMTIQVDGIPIGRIGSSGGAAWSTFSLNDAAAQEISFETGAISAETSSGGVRVNVIPREGGNRFSGSLFGNFATSGMSMSNFTDDLKARGAQAPAGFDKLWDESAAFGGPIRRDRVWFFVAHRYRGNDIVGTAYYSKDPLAVCVHAGPLAAAALGRLGLGQPGPRDGPGDAAQQSVRLLRQSQQVQLSDRPGLQPPDGRVGHQVDVSQRLSDVRELAGPDQFEAALGLGVLLQPPEQHLDAPRSWHYGDVAPLGTRAGDLHVLRAPFPGDPFGFPGSVFSGGEDNHQNYLRGALSYVTGSHAAKVGFSLHTGARANSVQQFSNDTQLVKLFNGVSDRRSI